MYRLYDGVLMHSDLFFFLTFQMSSYIPARGGAAVPELRLSIKEVRQRGANRK